MVKASTIYTTKDGQTFDNEDDAVNYERKMEEFSNFKQLKKLVGDTNLGVYGINSDYRCTYDGHVVAEELITFGWPLVNLLSTELKNRGILDIS